MTTDSLILIFHIIAGSIAVLSGGAAIAFSKGSPRHRVTGNIFVISMLAMSASATYLEYIKPNMHDEGSPILAATGWIAARRKDGETGLFEILACLIPLGLSVSYIVLGLKAANGDSSLSHVNLTKAYIFAALVAILG